MIIETQKYSTPEGQKTIHYLSPDNHCKIIKKLLWWQSQNLSYTASGYGSKIPTNYIITINNRNYRIYAIIYSNAGSLFITHHKKRVFIREHQFDFPE